MNEDIVTEWFPELCRRYYIKAGVNEYGGRETARTEFARAMRKHGYTLGKGSAWIKPGYAAVLTP